MRGRKSKPTHIHLVRGNPGKRARNANEAKSKRGIPAPPPHLSERGRAAWDAFATKLDRAGLLTELDAIALERGCEVYAEVVELEIDIAANKRTQRVKTKSGGCMERQRPQVAMLQDADRRLRAWLAEFGMTPAARARVPANPPGDGDQDPGAEFIP